MKCLLCGKESKKVLCGSCVDKADEELCYKIISYDYYNSDNDLWKQISEELEKTYLFKDYALEVADLIGGTRSDFIKILCFNKRTSYVGVPKDCREFVLSHADGLLSNDSLDSAEKNMIRSLVLGIYTAEKDWNKSYDLVEKIEFDDRFLEPYLIVADYWIKLRDYETAQNLLHESTTIFTNVNDSQRIYFMLKDCNERQSGAKKPWKPSKAEEIKEYYAFLDEHDIQHDIPGSGGKKNKVNQKDFKPYQYHSGSIPGTYVALWLTSEFYVKQREVVEINAIRVNAGKEVERFHSFVKPVNTIKSYKYVDPNDLVNAKAIKEVFPEFLSFLGDDVIAIAGVEEQSNYLSRLARYTMMDHIDNPIFDVVAYGEDLSDDFDLYTRDTILEKYGLKEGKNGMEKADVTVKLIEKMRG